MGLSLGVQHDLEYPFNGRSNNRNPMLIEWDSSRLRASKKQQKRTLEKVVSPSIEY
jgi:hypothetical protein